MFSRETDVVQHSRYTGNKNIFMQKIMNIKREGCFHQLIGFECENVIIMPNLNLKQVTNFISVLPKQVFFVRVSQVLELNEVEEVVEGGKML